MGYENNAINLATGTAVNHYGVRTIGNYGGETQLVGNMHNTKVVIKGTELDDTFADVLQDVAVPAGAIIQSCTLRVTEAFVGATATLDIGWYYINSSGALTALDADGIDAAIAVTAIDAIGDTIVCDGALAGASALGDQLAETASSYFVGASYNTAAFTAGEAELSIEWYMPLTEGVG